MILTKKEANAVGRKLRPWVRQTFPSRTNLQVSVRVRQFHAVLCTCEDLRFREFNKFNAPADTPYKEIWEKFLELCNLSIMEKATRAEVI